MRIDKYLQVSRLLKKRESAKQLCLMGRAWINGHRAKPGSEVNVDDVIKLRFGNRELTLRVLDIKKQVSKKEASLLYEVLESIQVEEPDENHPA